MRFLSKRIKASALFYAVTIALLVAMMMGSLILLTHYRSVRSLRWVTHAQVASNARSGIYAALSKAAVDEGPVRVALFEGKEDSASVEIRSWGGLDIVCSTAWRADQQAATTAVVGSTFDNRIVLDLARGAGPLHVCGDTRITGNVRVPMADVRRGYIEGRPFTGEQLVNGQVMRSLQDPAKLAMSMEDRIQRVASGAGFPSETTIQLGAERIYSSVDHEEVSEFPVLVFHGRSHLRGYSLRGPIVIRCNDTLSIDAENDMELVIIQAPCIIIDAYAELSVQCFASEGIILGEQAKLLYPSMLAVWRDEHKSEAARIELGEGALVQGAVVAVDRSIRDREQGSISIATGAMVQGEVYAEGGVELKGTITGTMIARDLILRTPSSIYRGHLMDAELIPYGLGEPVGFGCTGTDNERTVLKWGMIQHQRKAS